ncbi:MAG: phage major capsid protein [Jatrophihabitantaceae bacterium]
MSLITAKAQMAACATKAQAAVENPDLTNAEKRTILENLDVDIKSAAEEIELIKKMNTLMTGGDTDQGDGDPTGATPPQQLHKSFGEEIVTSPAYLAAVMQSKSAARFSQTLNLGEADTKAAAVITEGTIPAYSGGSGMGGQLVAPQFLPGIVPLKFQPLTVEALIASGSTTSPSVTYVVETAFQDLTAVVLESGKKPLLDLTLGRRQDNSAKIANIAKITDEMMQDAPQFQSYLTNRMTFGLQRVLEAQLLNGSGAGANMLGIMNRAGLAAPVTTAAGLTAVKAMEAIFNQITALRSVSFVEPDAFVINPLDWQTIRLGKDTNGQYYGGGPFAYGPYGGAAPSNMAEVWGLRGVVTTAIPQGTVLVGGFQECAQQFVRQGITVEMTNSNEDDFLNNLIAVRTETRRILAVYRPAGFGKVTLTA